MNVFKNLRERMGELWWYSLWLFVAQRLGDAINFVVGVWIVPRYVPMEELGAVLPLVNIVSVIGFPLAIVSIPFLKFIAVFREKGELGKAKSLIRDTFVATAAFSFVSVLIAYFVLPRFFADLRIENGSLSLLLILVAIASSVQGLFVNAASGLKLFSATVWLSALAAPFRLVAMLVFMPFRPLSGYMVGQGAAPAVGILGSLLAVRKFLVSPVPYARYWKEYGGAIWRYTWPLAIMAVASISSSNLDALAVRCKLDEFESAGYYLITRFSDIALYLGAAFTAFLLPILAGKGGDDDASRKLTAETALASLFGGIAVVVALSLFGERLLSVSAEWSPYVSFSRLMALFSVNATLLAVASAITMAFIARGRFAFLWYALPIMLAKSVYVYKRATTLDDIVFAFLVAQALTVFALVVHMFAFGRRECDFRDRRIAIVVHFHYPELVGELVRSIRNAVEVADCEVFATASNPQALAEAERRMREAGIRADCRLIENRGYDVGPFFEVLNRIDLSAFDYVVKLHTKRDLLGVVNCLPLMGASWRKKLLRFVSSPHRFAAALSLMECDSSIGAIGHGNLVLGVAYDYSGIDWRKVEAALLTLGLKHPCLRKGNFIAGTMFLVRASALKALVGKVDMSAFPPMSGREDDTSPAHVYERVLGLAIEAQGMTVRRYMTTWWFWPLMSLGHTVQRFAAKTGVHLFGLLKWFYGIMWQK